MNKHKINPIVIFPCLSPFFAALIDIGAQGSPSAQEALGVSPETREDKEAVALVNRLTEAMATQSAVAAASAAADVAAAEAATANGAETKSAAAAKTLPSAAAGFVGGAVAPVKKLEEARKAVADVLGGVDQVSLGKGLGRQGREGWGWGGGG